MFRARTARRIAVRPSLEGLTERITPTEGLLGNVTINGMTTIDFLCLPAPTDSPTMTSLDFLCQSDSALAGH